MEEAALDGNSLSSFFMKKTGLSVFLLSESATLLRVIFGMNACSIKCCEWAKPVSPITVESTKS